VGVEALQRLRIGPSAADAEVELRSELTLLLVATLEARRELRILGDATGPAFDATRRLQARDGRDEPRTGQPERRRKGLTRVVVRGLLRDRRMAGRTADDDAAEGTRRSSQLFLDRRPVVVISRERSDAETLARCNWGAAQRLSSAECAFRQAWMPLTMKRCSPGRM
jgi:hypothetical protein